MLYGRGLQPGVHDPQWVRGGTAGGPTNYSIICIFPSSKNEKRPIGSQCAQTVQEPCMTHYMLHRENVVAKDMNDEFSNVRSFTRYEIFHPYLSFSSYSILCPSLIEYRVMANCKGEKMSIINRIN